MSGTPATVTITPPNSGAPLPAGTTAVTVNGQVTLNGCLVGMYSNFTTNSETSDLKAREASIGRSLDIHSYYIAMGDDVLREGTGGHQAIALGSSTSGPVWTASRGLTPFISYPNNTNAWGGPLTQHYIARLLNGDYDAQIAADIRRCVSQLGIPFGFRFHWEWNGNWPGSSQSTHYPWQITSILTDQGITGDAALTQFIAASQHLADIVRANDTDTNGNHLASLIWNPNGDSSSGGRGTVTWNESPNGYWGNADVDIPSLDQYAQTDETWAALFDAPRGGGNPAFYTEYTQAKYAGKRLIHYEHGRGHASDYGTGAQTQAAWLTAQRAAVKLRPATLALIYYDHDQAQHWAITPIGSTDDGMTAYKATANDPYFKVGLTSATYTIDGGTAHPLVVRVDGDFRVPLTGLAAGVHTLVVTVTDRNGNTTTQSQSFTILGSDTTPPTFPTPPETPSPQAYGTTSFTFHGSVADTGGSGLRDLIITGPGGPYTVTVNPDATYAQTVSFPGTGGSYTYTFTARDNAGNTTSITRTVTVTADTTPPLVTPADPASGSTSVPNAQTTYIVQVDAADTESGVASVTIGGGAAALVSGTRWQRSIALATGTNNIPVAASDNAGNTSPSVTVSIERIAPPADTTAPVVTYTTPSGNTPPIRLVIPYTQTTATLAGTVTDDSGTVSSFTINGAPVSVGTGGAWTYPAAGLPVGDTSFLVEATDPSGNTYSQVVVITRSADTTAPLLTVTAPDSTPLPEGTTSIPVSGSVSDAESGVATLAVTVNTGAAQPLTVATAWSGVASGLVDGANTLRFDAVDHAGNRTSVTVTVPVIELPVSVLAPVVA